MIEVQFNLVIIVMIVEYCQAQPKSKPKLKLAAERAIFSIVTTTHPATHPATHRDKFKFDIKQQNSQKQRCLPSWVGPINAFGSILSPIIDNLYQHQA